MNYNLQIFAPELCKGSLIRSTMKRTAIILDIIIWFSLLVRPTKIVLLQCYVGTWSHFIDTICISNVLVHAFMLFSLPRKKMRNDQ